MFLKINPNSKVISLSSGEVIISLDGSDFILRDAVSVSVISSVIDGSHTLESIVNSLSDSFSPALLIRYANVLVKNNIIYRDDNSLAGEPFFSDSLASEELSGGVVNYLGLSIDCLAIDKLRESFSDSLDFVVLVDDFLDSRLDELNRRFRSEGKRWILVKPFGHRMLASPIIDPSTGACWSCFSYRMKLHRPLLGLINDDSRVLYSGIPDFDKEIMESRIFSILDFVSKTDVENNIFIFDENVNFVEKHLIEKRPQCSVCGEEVPKVDYFGLPLLDKERDIVNTSGGYRSFSAESTYDSYKHLISPLTGIMTGVSEYRKIDGAPIYNYSSGRNLAFQSKSMFWLNNHMRSSSGGKGKTKQQAKTGALCEAIERYSMVYHGQNPDFRGSYNEISEDLIEPNECMNFSDLQFSSRDEINKDSASFFSLVPVKLSRDSVVDWTPVYSLSNNRLKYLPSAFCYAQYPSDDESNLISYPDSNGCASGNTYDEAILQGTLELIERDAAAIWWYNKIQRPEVDLELIDNEYIDKVVGYYKSIGRVLHILDITTDIGVPSFVSVSYNKSTGGQILYGFGCHVDPYIAAERSVIELNQLMPILLTKRSSTSDQDIYDWLEGQTISANKHFIPLGGRKVNINDQYRCMKKPSLVEAIELIIAGLANVNIELLFCDLTQPDIKMPVVKMIAPGLRHYWRRTGPGRLYDVPLKMGWLDKALSEHELNGINITI